MINKLMTVLSIMIFLTATSFANDKNGNEVIFKIAEEKINPIIESLEPKVTIEYPKHTNSLVISYRKRKFMVHSTTLTGKHSKKARETDGPDYKGFILSLNIQPKGTVNELETPQILKRPYWNTYVNVTVVKDADKQIYWFLSYGSRMNKQLLKKIKDAISELEK